MANWIEGQRRHVLHQTLTGSVGEAGTYTCWVGSGGQPSLDGFTSVRLTVLAPSSPLTIAFDQQISSHATLFDVQSGGLAVTSGGGYDFAVYGSLGRFSILADSNTSLRIRAAGVPIG